ncbi:hypothetical protein JOF56_001766 [Kibdelosporangium banguiense]|uniref:Excreted virulence factor EspC, type VII ESX diderm n=1 Tax=Kibdelosporangium banguiense TaxID=1365924 RepID=A0ABS4TAM0_9PSEU|nr:hypothetical protein [Kibdelosporangium banguiense]MBP2321381.1 hypothetical protein [Kibdelosporangium banguiense]
MSNTPSIPSEPADVTYSRRDNIDRCADIREHVEDLSYYLARWAERETSGNFTGSSKVRRAANEAMDATDAALRDLHRVRATLVGEIRQSDDANTARLDALLADRRAE